MRPGLRRALLKLHRWVGLTFGLVLLLSAFTGMLLVLARPLDEALHPELFTSAGEGRAALHPVVLRLRAEFGADAAFNLRLPDRPHQSMQATVSGPWTGTIYLDATSGSELGRRAAGQGFLNTLFELHSTLLSGETGRALLAGVALAFTAMLISGLSLWWPLRWTRAFSIRTRAGATVALLDLHRVAGAALGLLVMVSVSTGAYMAWRPLADWVTHLAGQPSAVSPKRISPPPPEAAAASIDAAVERAGGYWAGAVVSIVHVPARTTSASRLRLKLPDDPHPIGMTTVWLDPSDGSVRQARRWSDLDAGNRAFSVIYPLHTGRLYGFVTLTATFASGVALVIFGCTGLCLWWRRVRS